MSSKQKIDDQSNNKKYFHIMLNMADDDLDPYEYRLLGHYIRRGKCWESVRTTAKCTQMSVGMVHKTRVELEKKGYIAVSDQDDSSTKLIVVKDRMQENIFRYARSQNEQDESDVHGMNDTQGEDVHEVNDDVHGMKQRRPLLPKTLPEEDTQQPSVVVDPEIKEIASFFTDIWGQMPTPYNVEQVYDLVHIDQFPIEWVKEAFERSADNNKRFFNYMHGVLKKWRVEGKDKAPIVTGFAAPTTNHNRRI